MGPGHERVLRAASSDREPLPPDLAQRAARVLSAGGVVALPTETVYGLAVRADREDALARLRELKGRGTDHPLTWAVGRPDALERYPGVSPMARRLAARYWPGPLTLVLPGVPPGLEAVAQDGWCGVRLPAQVGTAELLAGLDFPVVLTSANRTGEAPLTDGGAVAAAFGPELELIIDGGPARLAEPSAVLRLGPGTFELLRAGLLDLPGLQSAAGLRIAFCCTGNTCRSPMAEGLLRRRLAERLEVPEDEIGRFGFRVTSMGVAAGAGAAASPLAVAELAERAIDIRGHRSQPAAAVDFSDLDVVLGLTRSHVEALGLLLPPGTPVRVELLDPAGEDVPDPIGGGRADYGRAADRIAAAIERRLDDWV